VITEIRLYGRLGKRFGKQWRLDIAHPAQAVSALDALRPGFRRYIAADLSDFDFHVQVGGQSIGEERLTFPSCGRTISITPVLQGSDTKNILKVVTGVSLIIAGVIIGIGSEGTLSIVSTELILLGLGSALGGIAGLLSPSPAAAGGPTVRNKPSYIMNGAVNSIEQGLPVPVLLGEGIIGSAVVSGGVQNTDITKGSTSDRPDSDPGGGGGKAAKPIAHNRRRHRDRPGTPEA
jgi:predicted phage tail protein